jgi:hypothetical protein
MNTKADKPGRNGRIPFAMRFAKSGSSPIAANAIDSMVVAVEACLAGRH